jgi:hypothetical protein
MTQNFLSQIEGYSAEDFATQALAFFLSSSEYSAYQKLIYSKLFDESRLADTFERKAVVDTQRDFGQNGRPDLIIDTPEMFVLVENKFWAAFSLGDQYWRYFKILKEQKDKKPSLLVLLALQNRMAQLRDRIFEQFQAHNIDIRDTSALVNYLATYKIRPVFITWEEILSILTGSDSIVKSFREFIHFRYIQRIEFSQKELMMINDATIPNLIGKIWDSVDQVRAELVGVNITTGRMAQSRVFYGFNIQRQWGVIWFGLYMTAWQRYGTPYVMQFRDDWVTKPDYSTIVHENLLQQGFVADSELGLILPLRVSNENQRDSLIPEILKVIQTVDNEKWSS